MCIICDHEGRLVALGKEIGDKFAKTTVPAGLIDLAARKSANIVYESILKTVAIDSIRKLLEHPTAQLTLLNTYGAKRTEEINKIVANIASMSDDEFREAMVNLRAEIMFVDSQKIVPEKTEALTVKGLLN